MSKSLIMYGDPHLQSCAWVSRPTLSGDAFVALDAVVKLCLEHNADLVVPGDLFDSPNPPSLAVDQFRKAVKALRKAGLDVISTQGNHDLVPTGDPKWGVLCGTTDGDARTFQAGGLTCYGLDYRPQKELQLALADVPPLDVLFVHQFLDLYDNRPGLWNMAAECVPAHVRTVALNDIHEKCMFACCGVTGHSSIAATNLDRLRSVHKA